MKLCVNSAGAGDAALFRKRPCEGVYARPCRAVKHNERVLPKDVLNPAPEVYLCPNYIKEKVPDVGIHGLEVIRCYLGVQRHAAFPAHAFVVQRCGRNGYIGINGRSPAAAVDTFDNGIDVEPGIRVNLFQHREIVLIFIYQLPKRAFFYAGFKVQVIRSFCGRDAAFSVKVKGAHIKPQTV